MARRVPRFPWGPACRAEHDSDPESSSSQHHQSYQHTEFLFFSFLYCRSISGQCGFLLFVLIEIIQYMFFVCFALEPLAQPRVSVPFLSKPVTDCSSLSWLSGFLFMNKPDPICSAAGRHWSYLQFDSCSFENLMVHMCRFAVEAWFRPMPHLSDQRALPDMLNSLWLWLFWCVPWSTTA